MSKTIAVCLPSVPFTTGGAEIFSQALIRHLKRRSYQAELVSMPFSFFPKEQTILDALAWRLPELKQLSGHPVEVAIPLKFPAYMLRHPCKVAWLCHQHRAAYELFDTPFSDYVNDEEGRYYRDLITTMDNRALPECRKIFTIGHVVSERLEKFNGIDSETLHIPMVRDLDLRCDGYGDFLLHVGRINMSKRIHLAIEALQYTSPSVRLLLAGRGEIEEELKSKAAEMGVADRVEFLGFVSEEELIYLYANAFAVFFAPKDEDFGIITIEAFHAHKPVITCTDAGEPLEFVKHNETGCVCPPDPLTIGAAIENLYNNRSLCQELGNAGHERIKDLTWDSVIDRLAEYF